jgi:hypothetical protein
MVLRKIFGTPETGSGTSSIGYRSEFLATDPEVAGSGLEQGPLSFVSTIEELLGRNSSVCGLEIREYGRRGLLRWPRDTLYPQELTLTSPTMVVVGSVA